MAMLGSEASEQAFVRSLNPSLIKSWEHFEYVLSFIVENRFLRIYQAYMQNKQERVSLTTHAEKLSDKKSALNRKKKQAKKLKARAARQVEEVEQMRRKVSASKI